MRHDDFAVEHKSFRLQFERGTHQFGKISREILTRFRAEIDIVTMAGKQTAKTVPFGLVLPLRPARNGVDGARFHRRQPLRPGGFSCGPLLYEQHTSQRKRPAIRRPSGLIIVFEADQTAAVIHCCSFCFGAAPTWREAISPPLKIIRVGIDITPYFEAVFGLSSTFSLTILTLSPIAPEISSSAGAIMRQGPHHSAQKSTTTGPVALSTSASKSASETLPTAMVYLVRVEQIAAGIAAWIMHPTYERGP